MFPYNLNSLNTAITEPSKILYEFPLIGKLIVGTATNLAFGCEDFLDADWDNLIILDACRPDKFEKINDISGDYHTKISKGASSNEFFIRNMLGCKYYETVYVTGNTSVEKVQDSLYNVVKTYADRGEYKKGWAPDITYEAAVKANLDFPNKRLVVHFMQPHTPYLGPLARDLRKQVSNRYEVEFVEITNIGDSNITNSNVQINSLLHAFKKGYINKSELEIVYEENLELVLQYVKKLLPKLVGKTVVTADHSESFGDYKSIIGHRDWAFSSSMREVPWLVRDGRRKSVTKGEPLQKSHASQEIIERNMRELGYL
jgi:hypothetical protein